MLETKLGPDHPDTLISRINLADAYRDRRPDPRRSPWTRRRSSAEGQARPRPPRHTHLPQQPGRCLRDVGRLSEAIALHEATFRTQRGQARPRTPRHARPQQSRQGLRVARPLG